jgi:hypothetical protein
MQRKVNCHDQSSWRYPGDQIKSDAHDAFWHFLYGRRLLFIGAHPDDIELGCGAMIAQVSQKTRSPLCYVI